MQMTNYASLKAALGSALAILLSSCLLHCNSNNTGGNRSPLPLPNQIDAMQYNLDARLDGRYVKEIRIEEGNWSSIGSQQDVVLKFLAAGMSQIKQFELDLELDPATAFDLEASNFVPAEPFMTFGNGIELLSSNKVKIGAANFMGTTSGDAVLGTLNLRTASLFNPRAEIRIRIVLFSMGPTSANRDAYTAEDLDMGVIANKK